MRSSQRRYEDALYADGGGELPLLLSPSQERELWEEAIRARRWQQRAARRAAHRRRREGRLEARAMNGASRVRLKIRGYRGHAAFADWARAYAKRCRKEGLVDAAPLPDLSFEVPKTSISSPTPSTSCRRRRRIFSKLQAAVCSPEKRTSKDIQLFVRVAAQRNLSRPRAGRARAWRRARARIGVVVPGAGAAPARGGASVHAGDGLAQAPFSLSLGEPLSGYPLVGFALSLLEFSFSEKPFEEVSRILRSPFLGGAETGSGRARAAGCAPAPRRARDIVLAETDWISGRVRFAHPARGDLQAQERQTISPRLGRALPRAPRGGRLPGRAHARTRPNSRRARASTRYWESFRA